MGLSPQTTMGTDYGRQGGLNTSDYLPEVHYHQVRDAWHGLRTPSGQ